jgi:hypothetical protein
MRRLILAFAFLVSHVAFAHDIDGEHSHAKYFKNNVDGLTVITDKTKWCAGMRAFDGYAFAANGEKTKFCWVPIRDGVFVTFEGGETGVWPMAVFEDMPPEIAPDLNVLFPENTKDL